MKLKPNGNKAKITWVLLGYRAYDVKCSCGWQTKTGGAIKSCVSKLVWEHKYFDHDYQIV